MLANLLGMRSIAFVKGNHLKKRQRKTLRYSSLMVPPLQTCAYFTGSFAAFVWSLHTGVVWMNILFTCKKLEKRWTVMFIDAGVTALQSSSVANLPFESGVRGSFDPSSSS